MKKERLILGLGLMVAGGVILGSYIRRRFFVDRPVVKQLDYNSSQSPAMQTRVEQPTFNLDWWRFNREQTNQDLVSGVRIVQAPITAEELLGDEQVSEPGLNGFSLGKTQLRFAAIDRKSQGSTEYLGVLMAPLDGTALNKILLVNATNKAFGLDSGDIYNDWGGIDADTPDMQARKTRHEQMGLPWFVFDRDRPLFRFIIGRDQLPNINLERTEPRPMMLAVMRWVNSPTGRSFIYDLPEEEIYQKIISGFLADNQDWLLHFPNLQCYNPTVGIWTVGYFSPDVRSNWRRNYGYTKPEDATRGNGTTQAAVQTLRFDHNWYREEDGLLGSRFISQAEAFIENQAQEVDGLRRLN